MYWDAKNLLRVVIGIFRYLISFQICLLLPTTNSTPMFWTHSLCHTLSKYFSIQVSLENVPNNDIYN